MSLKRVVIIFLIIFHGKFAFSQWHQLPDPKPGSLTLPLINGKLLFGKSYYGSTSSGGTIDLYKSMDDMKSHGACMHCPFQQIGCCGLGNYKSSNDSSYSYVFNDGTWPRIYFTFNDYKKYFIASGVTLGSNSNPVIVAHCITSKYVYYTARPYAATPSNIDTLFFIKTDTGLVKTITKFPLYGNSQFVNGKMDFVNDSIGLLLTYYKSNLSKSVLVKTLNYGQTWSEIHKDSINKINNFSFPSINIGYLTKFDGSIHKTINGGTTWSLLNSPTTSTINSIKFETDLLGYIASNNGQLWKTIDGGVNWISEVSATSDNINAVYTFSNVAYFVTASNKVYKNAPDVIGIKELKDEQSTFSVYPNPSDDKITIDVSAIKGMVNSIKIINVLGEIVKQKLINEASSAASQTFSVKELPSGTYFVVVETGDGIIRKKIAVSK